MQLLSSCFRLLLQACLLLRLSQVSALALESGRATGQQQITRLRRRDSGNLDSEPVVGDVSAVDNLRSAAGGGAETAAEVANQLGGVAMEKIENSVSALKDSVIDPVGAIGGVAEGVAKVIEDGTLFDWPETRPGLADAYRPESDENVLPYRAQAVTAPPAPFNGVFCRGGACQYRRPPPPTAGPGSTKVAVETQVMPELCRGLACPPRPEDPAIALFTANCSHIFLELGEPLRGDVSKLTIADVRDNYVSTCEDLFPAEAEDCPQYGQIFVGALAESAGHHAIPGGIGGVCRYLQGFIGLITQAEMDLALSVASFSSAASAASAALLASPSSARPRNVGPCTANGLRWREWWMQRYGRRQQDSRSLLLQQTGALSYSDASNPCQQVHVAPLRNTAYQIAPGSPDGSVPPAEVRGDVFLHCRNQLDEITLSQPREATVLIQMARDWCAVQSMLPDPDDPNGFPKHPEWDFHSCTRIGQLLALSLRVELSNIVPIGSMEVCKKMFLSLGVLHRVDRMVHEAWSISGRSPGQSLSPPSEDDPEQQELARAASKHAREVYEQLKQAKEAEQLAAEARASVAGWDGSQSLPTLSPAATKPPLPSTENFGNYPT